MIYLTKNEVNNTCTLAAIDEINDNDNHTMPGANRTIQVN
jgi:hypothetical protein